MFYRLRYKNYIVGKVEAAQESIKKKFEEITCLNIVTSDDAKTVAHNNIMSMFMEKFNAEDTSRLNIIFSINLIKNYYKEKFKFNLKSHCYYQYL